jgi:hypothetical protein
MAPQSVALLKEVRCHGTAQVFLWDSAGAPGGSHGTQELGRKERTVGGFYFQTQSVTFLPPVPS